MLQSISGDRDFLSNIQVCNGNGKQLYPYELHKIAKKSFKYAL